MYWLSPVLIIVIFNSFVHFPLAINSSMYFLTVISKNCRLLWYSSNTTIDWYRVWFFFFLEIVSCYFQDHAIASAKYVWARSENQNVPLVGLMYLVIFTRMPGGVTVASQDFVVVSLVCWALLIPFVFWFYSSALSLILLQITTNSFWGQRVNVCMCLFMCWASFEI